MRLLIALSVLLSIQLINGLRVHNHRANTNVKSIPVPKTYYTTQFLDHFNSRDDRQFQQRYLVNGKKHHKLCLLAMT